MNDGDRYDGDPWREGVERLLARALGETKLLGVASPLNAEAERARLVEALELGNVDAPRWTYAPMHDADAVRRALDASAHRLEALGSELAKGYAARARELSIEAEMAGAVGTAAIGDLARRRFSAESASDSDAADALAQRWADEASDTPSEDETTIASDADDPRSLASRMREEIGRARLPFRVVTQRGLAPLAATGERTVWIAAGRPLTREEVERTVLHEIEAHARPRVRAMALSPALFALGTARGVDQQEGLALVLEERHGFLRGARRRELSLRHRVVAQMDAGATFQDVVRTLTMEELPPRRAILVAERAFRGGTHAHPGLGRERVYLPSFVRVAAHLRAHPAHERILASGQVAIDAIPLLARFVST